MAKQLAKPITVKISSAAKAMEEFQAALSQLLSSEESSGNEQVRDEMKLQGQLATLEEQLDLTGTALNGPPVGLALPSTSQLLRPLREICQKQGNFPSDRNPFENQKLDPSAYTAVIESGKKVADQTKIVSKAEDDLAKAEKKVDDADTVVKKVQSDIDAAVFESDTANNVAENAKNAVAIATATWEAATGDDKKAAKSALDAAKQIETQESTDAATAAKKLETLTKVDYVNAMNAYNQAINDSKAPADALAIAKRELDRLSNIASSALSVVTNYTVQNLMYHLLYRRVTPLLALFNNSSNMSLEMEQINYLQSQFTTQIQQTVELGTISGAASTGIAAQPAVPSQPSLVLLGAVDPIKIQAVLDALSEDKNQGIEDKINKIENDYVDAINGFNSTLFPPPGGKDFLTNLGSLVMMGYQNKVKAIDASMGEENAMKKKGLQLATDFVKESVRESFQNQLSSLGIQGTLLADALDNESAAAIKENVSSVLNFLDTYKAYLSDTNAAGLKVSQSLLAANDAANDFLQAWNAGDMALQGNTDSFASAGSLLATMHGAKKNNRKFLEALFKDDSPRGGLMLLDNAENISTQVAAQLAGLVFMSGVKLSKTEGLNLAASVQKIIADRLTEDVETFKDSFAAYTKALSAYLLTNQSYREVEATGDANANVEAIVNSLKRITNASLTPFS